MDLTGFKPADHQRPDRTPVPAGKYKSVITGETLKTTKKGDGSYIEVTFDLLEGEHKGRKVWARLTYQNPNATAQAIGHAQLAELCIAIGKPNGIKNTAEMLNQVVMITLKVSERNGYAPTNEVTKFELIGQTPTNATAGEVPPWA